MTAPDIEAALTAAFAERHAHREVHRPSLVDVHRRAHRRRSRRAAVRAGAVVGAGAAVLAGVAWTTTRRDDPPAAHPLPADGSARDGETASTVLSVESLWAAVAAQLGVDIDELRAANPAVDFAEAPAPGTALVLPGPVAPAPPLPASSSPGPSTTVFVTLPPPPTSTVTLPSGAGPIDGAPMTTVVVGPIGADCALDDAQAQVVADVLGAPLSPGDTVPVTVPAAGLPAGCGSLPPVPPGWTLYVIAAGDYVAGVAERFCATADDIVAGNGWPDLDVPIFPGSLIAVPVDAC